MKTYIEISLGETFLINEDIMTRPNTTFICKRGTSATLHFKLLDENKQPVTLDDCAVTMTARKRNDAPVIENLICSIAPNQQFEAGRGRGSFILDADIPRGEYQMEITVLFENGALLKFPNNERQAFGIIKVTDSLEK